MTEVDTSWIEKQRTRSESNDQWALRKSFIEKYASDYPRPYLVCLSQVFVNRIYLKCTYAPALTDLVERLGQGLTSEHPELVAHPPKPDECVLPTVDDDEEEEDVTAGTPPEADQLPPPMFGPLLQVQEESNAESNSESGSSDDGSTGDELGGTTRSECVTASGNEATVAPEPVESSLPQAHVLNAPVTHDATSGESAVCESLQRLVVKKKRRSRRKRDTAKEAASGDEAEDEESPPTKDTLMTPPPSPEAESDAAPSASDLPLPKPDTEVVVETNTNAVPPVSEPTIPPSPPAVQLPCPVPEGQHTPPEASTEAIEETPRKRKRIDEHISCVRRLRSLLFMEGAKQGALKRLQRAADRMTLPIQVVTDVETDVTTLRLDDLLVLKHKFPKDSDVKEATAAAAVEIIMKNDAEVRDVGHDRFELWWRSRGPEACYEWYWINCLFKAGKRITDDNRASATETLRAALKALGQKFETSYNRPKGGEQSLVLRVGDVILAQKTLTEKECKGHKQAEEALSAEVVRKIRGQIRIQADGNGKYVLN